MLFSSILSVAGPSNPTTSVPAQLPTAEPTPPANAKFNFVEFEEEAEGEDGDTSKGGADEGDDANAEEEDTREDDLETSFSVLDMARTILVKNSETEEAKLKLASVYNALGEVATESGR